MSIKDQVLNAIRKGTMPGGFNHSGQVVEDSDSGLSMVTFKLPRQDVDVYDNGVWQDVPDVERQEIVQDLLDERVANDIMPINQYTP